MASLAPSANRRVPAANGPGLIHAYFQPLPDDDFLHADTTFAADGTLSVTVRIDSPGMDPRGDQALAEQIWLPS